jgi:hypothetical protein
MRKLKTEKQVQEIEKVREKLDAWRAGRRSGASRRRIPEQLWRQAVKLAAEHGADRTRRALGLNHRSLKERIEKAGRTQEAQQPTFMELPGGLMPPCGGSVVELESGDGQKMRIQLASGERIDVAELARSFCGVRR